MLYKLECLCALVNKVDMTMFLACKNIHLVKKCRCIYALLCFRVKTSDLQNKNYVCIHKINCS